MTRCAAAMAWGIVLLSVATAAVAQTPPQKPQDAAEKTLRAAVSAAPQIPGLEATPLAVPGVALGMVSWVTSAPDATVSLLQRGDQADPVLAIDRTGKVLRSWGRGRYVMPHAIRVDPQGNVWTTDAASKGTPQRRPAAARDFAQHEIPAPGVGAHQRRTDLAVRQVEKGSRGLRLRLQDRLASSSSGRFQSRAKAA